MVQGHAKDSENEPVLWQPFHYGGHPTRFPGIWAAAIFGGYLYFANQPWSVSYCTGVLICICAHFDSIMCALVSLNMCMCVHISSGVLLIFILSVCRSLLFHSVFKLLFFFRLRFSPSYLHVLRHSLRSCSLRLQSSARNFLTWSSPSWHWQMMGQSGIR